LAGKDFLPRYTRYTLLLVVHYMAHRPEGRGKGEGRMRIGRGRGEAKKEGEKLPKFEEGFQVTGRERERRRN
jgi:hypothetical protein